MSKTALIFPGQGSQYVGMAKDLLENFSYVSAVFEEASDSIGIDLKRLSTCGPDTELNKTANTQPAILTASIAAIKVLDEETGIKGDILAGHSLGEYTALVHSGVIPFTKAVQIVRKRGEFMQDAVPEGHGAMAAILGMESDAVAELCSDAAEGEILSAANFNSPGQIVIAGQRSAVERAAELAKERGAKRAILLPVSVPSHCKLMESAAKSLRTEIEALNMGDFKIPVISNVEASAYPSTDAVADLLVRQLSSPVKWDDSVRQLKKEGVSLAIEVGPGKVLSGLVKRIDRDIKILNIEDAASLKKIEAENL
ncbi:MAG: ACP S-malonyltransferase [Proteobacteria bacterium]|nr:ACP S-malonyltransferase [Pseudomonadota bacterium]